MIDKTYQPAEVEKRIYALWEEAGAFRAGRPERREAEPYCIVIPPPNVTGSLHMGHALNNTLQDVLCRFERMRGKDVLWQPGTDHAGIATQMVVERQLMERQEPGRRALGREKFLEKVWAWKAESGGTIINQLKRLGASCDWSRERFTMDEGLSRAVLQGIRPALPRRADLQGQAAGQLGSRSSSPPSPTSKCSRSRPRATSGISNIRLEDVGDALHHRRDHAAGDHAGRHRGRGASGRRALPASRRQARDPAAGRPPHPDRRRRIFRSGEGHRRGQDHAGARLQRFRGRPPPRSAAGQRARPRGQAQSREQRRLPRRPRPDGAGTGRDAADARPRPLRRAPADRRAHAGARPGRQDRAAREHGAARRPLRRGHRAVPDRPVVRRRQDAWRSRRRRRCARAAPTFVPQQWEATYFNWMDNIQPWCISRQLWWGHQIPAWYGWALDDDGQLSIAKTEVFVAETEAEALQRAKNYYKKDVELVGSMDESLAKVGLRRQAAGEGSGLARRGRARHLVLVGAVAVLDARLAVRDRRAQALLSDQRAGDRLRHHLLLGRAHDDDGPSLHEGHAVPHRLHPRAGARRARRRRCRSRRATSSTRSS